jgi:hypothetical protein
MKLRLIVELTAGTRIDQNQRAASIDEKGVIGHVDRIGKAVLGQTDFDLLRRRGRQNPRRRIGNHAVVQRRDFEFAKHHAVKTRLHLDHGCRRSKRRESEHGDRQAK